MLLLTQIGSRQHYEPAAMAAGAGVLARMITDWWNPLGSKVSSFGRWIGSKDLERYGGRRRIDVPNALVRSTLKASFQSLLRSPNARKRSVLYKDYLRQGRDFAAACIPLSDVEHSVFMGFSTGALEMLIHERRNGIVTIVDQIDPGKTEYDLVYEEELRCKQWVPDLEPVPAEYAEHLIAEWSIAERVLVNSSWSRKALVQQGVDPAKIHVVPLPYRAQPSKTRNRVSSNKKLRVLWLGSVNIRKGFAYAIEAARMMKGLPVEFTFAGPLAVQLSNERMPDNCTFLGQIPRTRASDEYNAHDVFLFPTLSDGFGLTQVEAMAHGLPVIATENCGDVVEHGRSGLVIRARSASAIVDAITSFLDSPDQLNQFSGGACRRATDFSPEHIWPLYAKVFGFDHDSGRLKNTVHQSGLH